MLLLLLKCNPKEDCIQFLSELYVKLTFHRILQARLLFQTEIIISYYSRLSTNFGHDS